MAYPDTKFVRDGTKPFSFSWAPKYMRPVYNQQASTTALPSQPAALQIVRGGGLWQHAEISLTPAQEQLNSKPLKMWFDYGGATVGTTPILYDVWATLSFKCKDPFIGS